MNAMPMRSWTATGRVTLGAGAITYGYPHFDTIRTYLRMYYEWQTAGQGARSSRETFVNGPNIKT